MLYPWLLPTVGVHRSRSGVTFSHPPSALRLADLGPAIDTLVGVLDGEHTLAEVQEHPLWSVLQPTLDERGWLVRLGAPVSRVVRGAPTRTRQLSYLAQICQDRPDRAFEQLASATVQVVGLGGLGLSVAIGLAGSGIGRLVLCDPDVVEPHNLNRQFAYGLHDVGVHKTTAAARFLRARHPELEIVERAVDDDDSADTVDERAGLVVVTGELQALRDRPGWLAGTPVLGGGYFGHVGVLGPYLDPARDPDWNTLVAGDERARFHALQAGRVLRRNAWNCSGSTNNLVLGGLLADLAVRAVATCLGGPLLHREVRYVDMRTHNSWVETLA